MPGPHPLARRIHDRVLGNLATALIKTELCEQLGRLGREEQILETLAELRAMLEQTVDELRLIMVDLRTLPVDEGAVEHQGSSAARST
jgi:signal transduction histidine kinase